MAEAILHGNMGGGYKLPKEHLVTCDKTFNPGDKINLGVTQIQLDTHLAVQVDTHRLLIITKKYRLNPDDPSSPECNIATIYNTKLQMSEGSRVTAGDFQCDYLTVDTITHRALLIRGNDPVYYAVLRYTLSDHPIEDNDVSILREMTPLPVRLPSPNTRYPVSSMRSQLIEVSDSRFIQFYRPSGGSSDYPTYYNVFQLHTDNTLTISPSLVYSTTTYDWEGVIALIGQDGYPYVYSAGTVNGLSKVYKILKAHMGRLETTQVLSIYNNQALSAAQNIAIDHRYIVVSYIVQDGSNYYTGVYVLDRLSGKANTYLLSAIDTRTSYSTDSSYRHNTIQLLPLHNKIYVRVFTISGVKSYTSPAYAPTDIALQFTETSIYYIADSTFGSSPSTEDCILNSNGDLEYLEPTTSKGDLLGLALKNPTPTTTIYDMT